MSIFGSILSAIRSVTGDSDPDKQSTAEPSSRGTVSVEYDPADEEADSTLNSGSDSGIDSHEESVSTSASGDEIIPEPQYDTDSESESESDLNPDPSTEATIKGAELDGKSQTTDDTGDTDENPVSTDTDASASTGSLIEDATGKEPAEAVETANGDENINHSDTEVDQETPADTVGAETDASASTASLINEATGKEPAEAVVSAEATEQENDSEAADADSNVQQSVQSITGIGSTYAERLSQAGVDSVADLVASEPTTLAETADIAETRITRWVDQVNTDGETE